MTKQLHTYQIYLMCYLCSGDSWQSLSCRKVLRGHYIYLSRTLHFYFHSFLKKLAYSSSFLPFFTSFYSSAKNYFYILFVRFHLEQCILFYGILPTFIILRLL